MILTHSFKISNAVIATSISIPESICCFPNFKEKQKRKGKGKRKSIIFMCMTPYYYDSPKKAYTPHVLHLLIYYIYSLTLLQPFICPFYYNNCCLYRFIIYPFIILNCIFNFLLLQNMYFFFLSELED